MRLCPNSQIFYQAPKHKYDYDVQQSWFFLTKHFKLCYNVQIKLNWMFQFNIPNGINNSTNYWNKHSKHDSDAHLRCWIKCSIWMLQTQIGCPNTEYNVFQTFWCSETLNWTIPTVLKNTESVLGWNVLSCPKILKQTFQMWLWNVLTQNTDSDVPKHMWSLMPKILNQKWQKMNQMFQTCLSCSEVQSSW